MNPKEKTSCLALFILSGAAGLVYEACWSRQLGVLLGFTEKAMTASVAAFFLGGALGAWVISRRVSSLEQPLKIFGMVELGAGIWALGIPSFLEFLSGMELFATQGQAHVPITQFMPIALVLLPTTMALGASLPLMAEFLGRREDAAKILPRAYALHLAGSLSGLFGASFFGFLLIGVEATHQVGSALSVLVGVWAIILSREAEKEKPQIERDKGVQVDLRIYLVAALSGFSTLALQGLYFRAFSRTLQNSTYTFAAVLAVFLLSLSLGSARVGRMVRSMGPLRAVGVSSLIGAVLVPASVLLFTGVTHLGQLDPGDGFIRYMFIVFGLSVVVVAPAASCFGAILPALWLHMESRGIGFAVGRLAALNTLAAAAGSFFVGFFFLPELGLWGTVWVISVLAWLITALVVREIWEQPAKNFAVISIALVLLTGLASSSPTTRLRPGEEIKANWETEYGLLEVVRDDSNLMMRQNIHYVMGDTRSLQAEMNQGILPLLLHPEPQRVAFLGLATGITAGGALAHQSVEKVIAIEIIPEIVKALHYFETQNRFFRDDPRSEIVVGDAFHYFSQSDSGSFDAVVSDLFVPWHSQTGYLYTVEHFENVRARLSPTGIFALWISLREVASLEFRLIADSLRAVFPHVSVWRERVHPRKICIVGSLKPITLNKTRTEERMASVSPSASRQSGAFLTWEDITESYQGDWPEKTGVLLNTVDHPRVEHQAPLTERRKGRHQQDWLHDLARELFSSLPKRNIQR